MTENQSGRGGNSMIKVKKVFGVLLMATAAVIGTVSFPSVSLAASTFTDNFDSDNTSVWQKADGYSNGGVFGCIWRDSQIAFDKTMNITLNKDTKDANPKYAGGEYRSTKFYGYGLYEVNMKPAKNSGIVSSFFTYTGPSDKKPWDEIDIEFLGKDTTQFQANYYVNGVGNHEKMISLGFDASQSYIHMHLTGNLRILHGM
jgi:beta-glucanase (GH16 family)